MNFAFLGILLAFLLAGPAAANTWTDCSGNTTGEIFNISKQSLSCLDWADTTDPGVDSQAFHVSAKSALICFDPDTLTVGAQAAQINVRHCLNGQKPAATPENTCILMNTTPMTGIEGSAGVQDACLRVGPGTYYIEITNDGAASDVSRVTIRGEGD